MRRLAALPLGFALLVASFLAPYQHVHLAGSDSYDRGHDDDRSAIVHIHLYAVSFPGSPSGKPNVSGPDHPARALDTFNAVPQAVALLVFVPEPRVLALPPAASVSRIPEAVEPRGHDPPLFDFSTPRAPPV